MNPAKMTVSKEQLNQIFLFIEKSKRFIYSKGVVNVSMANQPPRPGLRMELSGRGELRQELRLAPPIADSLEEAASRVQQREDRLDDSVLRAVALYVRSEDQKRPYTDRQIFTAMLNEGYAIEQAEVARARFTLGIKPSSERYSI